MLGSDGHLSPVAAERLTPAAIEFVLRESAGLPPALRGDGGLLAGETALKPAAVLVGLVDRPQGLTVLLTERTAHLRAHAGQISFPGGRLEAGDETPAAGALREAAEEIGLPAQAARLLGELPPYLTVTGFEVTPVVAVLQPGFMLRPDPHEVADIFEVPLAFLMNPAHHRRHRLEMPDRTRQFLSMPYRGLGLAGLEREFFIWGATAAMLRNLYHRLVMPLPPSSPDIMPA